MGAPRESTPRDREATVPSSIEPIEAFTEVAPARLERRRALPEYAVTHVDCLRRGDCLDHLQGQVVDAALE